MHTQTKLTKWVLLNGPGDGEPRWLRPDERGYLYASTYGLHTYRIVPMDTGLELVWMGPVTD